MTHVVRASTSASLATAAKTEPLDPLNMAVDMDEGEIEYEPERINQRVSHFLSAMFLIY